MTITQNTGQGPKQGKTILIAEGRGGVLLHMLCRNHKTNKQWFYSYSPLEASLLLAEMRKSPHYDSPLIS